jgi:antitoxin HicB
LTPGRQPDPPSVLETLAVLYRIPLVFSPQPEGGFTVTSPVLPELVTEGDTLEEAYSEVSDALAAVVELYSEQGRALPVEMFAR